MSDPKPFAIVIVISDGTEAGRAGLLASLAGQPSTQVTVVGAGEEMAAAATRAIEASAAAFVAIIRPIGNLLPGAMAAVREHVTAHPEADIIYGDETAPGGGRSPGTLAKPIFSRERLRCQNYLGELVFYRRGLLSEIPGLDAALPGAELYDLVLRATAVAAKVDHLSTELFARNHAVDELLDDRTLGSIRRALEAHLAATGGGEVRAVGADGVHDTRRLVVGEPLISIVIPTRGIHVDVDGEPRCFVLDAVRSIVEQSTWSRYEIVLVIDSVAEQVVVDELLILGGSRLRFVEWTRPFNFSEKVNLGVLHADGEYVLLLNDDIQVITPDWLQAMLALAQRPGAGMVGCMLYYADETIQHAGHQYDAGDVSHIGLDAPRGDTGPLQGYRVERELAGVTAACALMPTRVFLEVGGLTNLLPGNFNDVDLCLKTTWQEHAIYWTPHAELYHFESKTRDAAVHAFEIDVAWRRWGFRLEDSGYWPYAFNRPVI